ncbi:hypothetical protein EDC04DRAFT_3093363 [Pisolithus marmoratus]|nr:hypothetical protein EDC04DRAFT_3093363 [Pisolithus marmoratus]
MGEYIVRTTTCSLPEVVHDYVQFIQPATMFVRFNAFRSTFHWTTVPVSDTSTGGTITGPAGNQVDASRNQTQFFRNEAYGSNYTIVSINGMGCSFCCTTLPALNSLRWRGRSKHCSCQDQYVFGPTYATPGIFYTTAVSLPFDPDARIPNNTIHDPYANRVCMGLAALGVHGVSLTFASGDYSVGDVPNILPIRYNRRRQRLYAGSSRPFPWLMANHILMRDWFYRLADEAASDYLSKLAPGICEALYNSDGRAYSDVPAQSDWFIITSNLRISHFRGERWAK